ncbi:MAG: hypothetical protein QOF41_3155 [Methylobacteriaceae bacterium]|nr:hypothetical protein [Methylobacteriaceae bacterium]
MHAKNDSRASISCGIKPLAEKSESEQPLTDAEIAERMDKAIRRSFTMPPGKKPAPKRKPKASPSAKPETPSS